MRRLLSGVIALVGLWLVIAPWITQHESLGLAQIGALAVGALSLILGIIGAVKKGNEFKVGDWLCFICGLAALIIGIVAFGAGSGIRVSLVIAGLLLSGISWVAVNLPDFTQTKMYSIEGQLMIEMKEMIADERGIGIKATLMGAMPATIYVRPTELWNLLSQITPHVLAQIGKLLVMPPKPQKDEKK